MRTNFYRGAILLTLISTISGINAQEDKSDNLLISGNGMKMIRVEPGSVTVEHPKKDEFPVVQVDAAYYLAATEVTQAQWQAVMEKNPSLFTDGTQPVDQVSRKEAMGFCEKLT